MNIDWPPKFTVKSDGNVLEFLHLIPAKDKKEEKAMYLYIKSRTKKGTKVDLTIKQIEELTA